MKVGVGRSRCLVLQVKDFLWDKMRTSRRRDSWRAVSVGCLQGFQHQQCQHDQTAQVGEIYVLVQEYVLVTVLVCRMTPFEAVNRLQGSHILCPGLPLVFLSRESIN